MFKKKTINGMWSGPEDLRKWLIVISPIALGSICAELRTARLRFRITIGCDYYKYLK